MIGLFFIFAGAVASIIGAVGLVRFPDVFSRSHAQTVISVAGAVTMLIGFGLETLGQPVSWKFFLLILLIFITSPTATHAITKAAYYEDKKAKRKK